MNHSKKTSSTFFAFFTLILLLSQPLWGQKEVVATINSKNFSQKNNALVIKFKLTGAKLGNYTYDIQSASMYSRKAGLIEMKSIEGDRRNLVKGKEYELVWSVIDDVNYLDDPSEARLSLVYSDEAERQIAAEEQQRKEEQENRMYRSANSVRDYQNYINRYPNGRYVEEAQRRIAELEVVEREEAAWKRAQNRNTEDSYNEYKKEYPRGKYVAEANTAIDRLKEKERASKKAARNEKRPFVTLGIAVRGGYLHMPRIFGDPNIQEAPIELSGLDVEAFPYAYDFDVFADLRISNFTYFQLGASLSKRHIRYVYESNPGVENAHTLNLNYLRINPAFKFGKLVLGGYYALNVNSAEYKYKQTIIDLGGHYEEALKNDYGLTVGIESRQRRKNASAYTDSYFVKNFLIGVGYELSLAGIINQDANIDNVDPALGDEDNTITPGYLYLKIGIRI